MSLKYILLDFLHDGGMDQFFLTLYLNMYPNSRIRDFHNLYLGVEPFVVFMNVIAKAVNASLIMHEKNYDYNVTYPHPTIIPDLRAFEIHQKTVTNIWNIYYSRSKNKGDLPLLFPFPLDSILDSNFAYCDTSRGKSDSVWTFSIFSDPFSQWIWIWLGTCLMVISIIAFSSINKLSFQFITTIAPLFGQFETSSKRHSGLFLLWMFACTILINEYSGEITSNMIKPVPDDMAQTAEQLADRNFTLVFVKQDEVTELNKMIEDTLRITKNEQVRRKQMAMQKLLHGATQEPFDPITGIGFAGFVYGTKQVAFCPWGMAIWGATRASYWLKLDAERRGVRNRRKCYVGKELIRYGPAYFTFLPPNNKVVARAYESLAEFGIAQLWIQEGLAALHSRRVQDRVRVKSPTKVVDLQGESEDASASLRLQGKMLIIFLLCSLCLAFSFACFLVECIIRPEKLIASFKHLYERCCFSVSECSLVVQIILRIVVIRTFLIFGRIIKITARVCPIF